jgi:hypothetical protein
LEKKSTPAGVYTYEEHWRQATRIAVQIHYADGMMLSA